MNPNDVIPFAVPDVKALAPLIAVALTGIALLLWGTARRGRGVAGHVVIAGAGVVVAMGLTWLLTSAEASAPLATDRFAKYLWSVCLLSAMISALLSVKYVREEQLASAEFLALMLLSTVGMMALAGATELITLFVGFELMALPVYILTGYYIKNRKSNEAAMKYFLLGLLSSGFMLYGISLLYGTTGTTRLDEIAHHLLSNGTGASPLTVTAVVLLLVTFGFKIACVPFHVWTPDAYEGAPTPVTAFMTVGPKVAVYGAMIRVFAIALPAASADWMMALSVMAGATMLLGNITAVVQNNVKRMLAYSTIAHAGYLLLGLISAPINRPVPATGLPDGFTAILFYLLVYGLANLGAFGVVIALGREDGKGTRFEEYDGLAVTHPVLAALMLVFMLSLTGIPPTAGFVGKFYLFGAAVNAKYYGLAVLGVLTSAVSLYYYMRIPMRMYMNPPAGEHEVKQVPAMAVTLLLCGASVLLLGVLFSPLVEIARESVRALLQV